MDAKRAADDGVEPARGAPAPGSSGETQSAPARAVQPQQALAGRRGFTPPAILGLILLTATLAASGFLGWQVFGTTWLARSAAAESVAQLRDQWAAATPVPPAEEGQPLAEQVPAPGETAWILRIPALGLEWPVAAGVDEDVLARAVGWYPSTALPGQVGNHAIAGFRLTRGAPLADLFDLAEGDVVVIETPLALYAYRITLPPSQLTVHRDDSWVLEPVPGKPDLAPTEAILTLTTHEDLIDTPDRAVGFGVLATTETK